MIFKYFNVLNKQSMILVKRKKKKIQRSQCKIHVWHLHKITKDAKTGNVSQHQEKLMDKKT